MSPAAGGAAAGRLRAGAGARRQRPGARAALRSLRRAARARRGGELERRGRLRRPRARAARAGSPALRARRRPEPRGPRDPRGPARDRSGPCGGARRGARPIAVLQRDRARTSEGNRPQDPRKDGEIAGLRADFGLWAAALAADRKRAPGEKSWLRSCSAGRKLGMVRKVQGHPAGPNGMVGGNRFMVSSMRSFGLVRAVSSLLVVAVTALGCANGAPDPLVCAAIGGVLGAGGGAAAGTHGRRRGDGHVAAVPRRGASCSARPATSSARRSRRRRRPPPPAPAPAPRAQPAPAPMAEKIVLRGVNFDFDKANIRPDAAVILDEAVRILGDSSSPVSIEGHTDWIGSDAYNQSLSERRAESVQAYLIEHGVDASRLSTSGYGESRPDREQRHSRGSRPEPARRAPGLGVVRNGPAEAASRAPRGTPLEPRAASARPVRPGSGACSSSRS